MLKTQELRNLSRQELKEKVEVLKKSLFQARTKQATGRLEKPSQIRDMRRDIARVLTVLQEIKRGTTWNPEPDVKKEQVLL